MMEFFIAVASYGALVVAFALICLVIIMIGDDISAVMRTSEQTLVSALVYGGFLALSAVLINFSIPEVFS